MDSQDLLDNVLSMSSALYVIDLLIEGMRQDAEKAHPRAAQPRASNAAPGPTMGDAE